MRYFYVDESGHTGLNLFDQDQSFLYYGTLGSKINLDILASSTVKKARRVHNIDRLHGNELRMDGIAKIAKYLIEIQRRLKMSFDMIRIAKADHAIICFFDQIFDQGVNPAMTWTGYWTPLRYVLLLKLAYLFDDVLAEKAWKARINRDTNLANSELIGICKSLKFRIAKLPDMRSRRLIGDTLEWVIKHPNHICYNCKTKKDILDVSPNIIGFQSVVQGITRRVGGRKKAASIVVDQQSQFNKSQQRLLEFYQKGKDITWKIGPGLPEMDLRNIPMSSLQFYPSSASPGLELVDIYIWLFKKYLEQQPIAPDLIPLIKSQLSKGRVEELSLTALSDRWSKWFDELPEPTESELEKGRELQKLDEHRRIKPQDL